MKDVSNFSFFKLLQFLRYVQNLDYKIDRLGTTQYRLCEFRVQDFLKHLHPDISGRNYYQLKKVLIFLDELQKNSIIKSFSDKHFRSLVTIPELNVFKSDSNVWIVRVWVAEELFYYSHPFILPNLRKLKTKFQFEVQFEIIRVFSSVNIEKSFRIKEFLELYPAKISNKQRSDIKKEFIHWVTILRDFDLIENNYKIMKDGWYQPVSELTNSNISDGFLLYEKIDISF